MVGKINCLKAAVCGVLAMTLQARADYRDDMWSQPVMLREGVTLKALSLDEPRQMKAYVARIDLATPGIGFAATRRTKDWGEEMPSKRKDVGGNCLAETVLESTAEFMARRRAEGVSLEVAVNSTPWLPFPAPPNENRADPLGLCVENGEVVSNAEGHGATFVVWRDGGADIVSAVPDSRRDAVAFATSGFDIIMKDGAEVPAAATPPGVHPRTAFGLTPDKKTLVLLVVDGRQPGYSIGADMKDLCAILRGEGVSDAINMDGGGSTSLVVFDRKSGKPWMVNRHSGGKMRRNAFNFGITFDGPDSALALERTASIYHSYEFTSVSDTPAPKGYAPFYISHYGRHGSRRLTDKIVPEVLGVFESAEKAGALTETGAALLERVRVIASAHDGMSGQLSERGAEEHRTLARRMFSRFPAVFSGERRVRCQSSIYHRVLLSQANFVMALKGAAPGLEFDFATGDRYQMVLNGHYFEFRKDKGCFGKAVSRLAVSNIDPSGLVSRLFANARQVREPASFARKLFECASICQCLRSELTGLDIYGFFTQDEIDALSRSMAVEDYCKMGNSFEFGGRNIASTRKLAEDFATRADEALADDRVAADLRFGHDSGLWPLAGYLALEGAGDRVPLEKSWRDCPSSKWMSMAANLQMVFYRRKGGGDILVKVLYNERETLVRGLKPVSGPYYRWSDLRQRLLKGGASAADTDI